MIVLDTNAIFQNKAFLAFEAYAMVVHESAVFGHRQAFALLGYVVVGIADCAHLFDVVLEHAVIDVGDLILVYLRWN